MENTNDIIQNETISELYTANFHTLLADDNTDIGNKDVDFECQICPVKSDVYKTISRDYKFYNSSIIEAIKMFYTDNELGMQEMVMFMSDGALVIFGDGVAIQLHHVAPHLLEQRCVAH